MLNISLNPTGDSILVPTSLPVPASAWLDGCTQISGGDRRLESVCGTHHPSQGAKGRAANWTLPHPNKGVQIKI